ncbi:AAA family ATPase [Arcanobacterium canis]
MSQAHEKFVAIRHEISKAVVGNDHAVTGVLVALLGSGHVLLEGVPGTAKTLLARSLAMATALPHTRVQFTPDLMPGDLTGSLIFHSGEFTFRPGPVFTSILLADEINRTPPKTQAALLEAMAEHHVSVDGQPKPLPDPFIVIATQNPIEHAGTYPLPEAQIDRFMMKLQLPLPSRDVELNILSRHAAHFDPTELSSAGITAVANADDIRQARDEVSQVEVSEQVLGYIVDLVHATRSLPTVMVGASPRGAMSLLAAARSWAWLQGRTYVTPDDVKGFALPTLVHRITVRPEAELDGIQPSDVISQITKTVAVPR